jgi:CheY-like chemotaxis protein
VRTAAERTAQALAERLTALGIEVAWRPGATAALGRLRLSDRPFPTLDGEERIPEARFYTLGAHRLKLYAPDAFFDLGALDIAGCESAPDLEDALRRSWAARVHELAKTREWAEALGATPRSVRRGTRLWLPLSGMPGAGALLRSRREILLPSEGPLEDRSPRTPAGRRMRPLSSFDCSSDLELAIGAALERASAEVLESREAPHNPFPEGRREAARRELELAPPVRERALLVAGSKSALASLERVLSACRFEVEASRDPQGALAALERASYDLVVSTVQLPRADGLELAARARAQAGVAELPIVLVDERPNPALAEAARRAGASRYLCLPLDAETLARTLKAMGARRRWVRYAVRMRVLAPLGDGELSDSLSRGGMCLLTPRELGTGERERYRLELPRPLGTIDVEGMVTSRLPMVGTALLRAGIRFVRFAHDAEPRWIRLIRALDERRGQHPRPEGG